ncbi:MAG: phosphatidylserine/phosphatidylglycerophosphate/cardiolipin synthase family protein [Halobacteriovoraceae bacterium]|nr:phosphatidylserine/phosphatidylglycerophosphate/cardiolipin synthase family protein [Halobacteriovoraceae bacterium]
MKKEAQEILFHQGDHFFDSLLSDCKKAKKEILIEAYIFETDDLGKRLLKVLRKKANEGIKVKILMDGIGSFSFCPLLFKKLTNENFEIRVFNPLPFQLAANGKFCWRNYIFPLFRGLFWINKRNHRKTYIIDQKAAYVGSINITRLHSFRLHGERSWRDTGIKLGDERSQILRNAFFRAWDDHLTHAHKTHDILRAIEITRCGVRLNDCRLSRALQNNELLHRINRARRRVWITNPYFVPTPEIIRALQKAGERGVSVSIIIPRKSDMKLFPLINSLASRQLAGEKIKVYEYIPRILHSKVMMIDDWCIVGSSNLNSRSLKHDLEVDVVLRQENNKASLIKQFLFDLADSTELNQKDILKKYGQRYFSSFFLNLIRYWL